MIVAKLNVYTKYSESTFFFLSVDFCFLLLHPCSDFFILYLCTHKHAHTYTWNTIHVLSACRQNFIELYIMILYYQELFGARLMLFMSVDEGICPRQSSHKVQIEDRFIDHSLYT